MASVTKLLFAFLVIITNLFLPQSQDLYFNGFKHAGDNIILNGIAKLLDNGIIQLTNDTSKLLGHAFYPPPIRVKSLTNGKAFSFSTVFAFAMVPQFKSLVGHGFVFTFAPSKQLPGAQPSQPLGLLNSSFDQFDEVQDFAFHDINDNHVGININSMISNTSISVGYYVDGNATTTQNIHMKSGETVLSWIDYSSDNHQLNVSLSFTSDKPNKSLLSYDVDLSPYLDEFMNVGFSASNGLLEGSHYLLGWSFKVNGQAKPLDLSSLPKLPKLKKSNFQLIFWGSVGSVIAFFIIVVVVVYSIRLCKNNRDENVPWHMDVGQGRYLLHPILSLDDFDNYLKEKGGVQILTCG